MQKLLLSIAALGITLSASADYPMNLLVEEFTGENCGNCPSAAAALHDYLEALTPEKAARTSVICHHVGYYNDWLTVSYSSPLTWYFNNGGATFAPAMMVNRKYFGEPDYPGAAMGMPRSAAALAVYFDPEFELTSNYDFDNTVTYNAADSTLAVHAKLIRAAGAALPRVTIYLTEDNIKAHNQAGAANFVHQHALRAANSNWGKKMASSDWKNNVYELDYTFKLDPSWKLEDLKVVTLANMYISTNREKSVVNQSKTTPFSEFATAGINDVVSDAEDANAPVEYFNLQGQRLAEPAAGQIVIRRQGRNTSKVIL